MLDGRASRLDVVAPDGRTWCVGVRWLPRPPRWLGWGRRKRRRDAGGGDARRWWDLIDVPSDFDVLAWIAVIAVVAFVLWWFVIPVLVVVLDIAYLLVVAGVASAIKVLFGRPWVVEASAPGDEPVRWGVVGWSDARREAARVARLLRQGEGIEGIDVGIRLH